MLRDLSEKQVNSVHHLFQLLRHLRVFPLIETRVECKPASEDGGRYHLYSFIDFKVFPGIYLTADDHLTKLVRLSEEMGLYDDQ